MSCDFIINNLDLFLFVYCDAETKGNVQKNSPTKNKIAQE